MPHNHPADPSEPFHRRAIGARRMAVAFLLLTFVGLTLNACASTSDPAKQASAQEARLAAQEHAEALELVSCARAHGIDLPEPTAENKVSTQGVNLKSASRKAALTTCYQKTVSKATKEHEAELAKEGKSPSEGATQSSTQSTVAFQREREQLMAVVACARRHGIDLPEPNSHNQVSTRGVHTKGHRHEVAMNNCLHKVVSKAAAEAQAEQREREAGPRRLGEEAPTAP